MTDARARAGDDSVMKYGSHAGCEVHELSSSLARVISLA